MTTRDFNPLPAGLTEADLLALVEGEPLARERAGAVARAVESNPALARELEAMKRDRAHLRSLGDVKAPSGLIDSVGAALQPVFERQMLLGLAEGDNIHEHPPVSMVIPRGRSLFSGRTVAIAAGIALLAGGVAFTVLSPNLTGVGSRVRGPVGPIASNTARSTGPVMPATPAAPDIALAKSAPETPAMTVAVGPAPTEDPQYGPMPSAEESPAETLAASSSETDYGPPAPEAIDAARALALAGEHRLVIRVVPGDGRFDRITERLAVRPRGAWQLAGAAPTELASLLDAQDGRPLPEGAIPDRSRMVGIGDAPEVVTLPGPPAPADYSSVPSVYVLNARMDEGTFGALESSLREIGADVVFEESARALPIDSAPVIAPSAVLWWGSGPSGWASWGSVPVVIQR